MSNQFDVAKVLDSLHEAKTAYEAVPGLKHRIDELETYLQAKNNEIERLNASLAETQAKLDGTSQKLQATQEERDQYYFRSEELAEKVEKTASLLGLVAPKTEPEPTVAEASHPQSQQGESASPLANEGLTSITTGMGQEQSATSPFVPTDTATSSTSPATTYDAPTSSNASTEVSGATTSSPSEGQSASPPTSPVTLSQSGNDGSSSEHSASNQDGATPVSGIASASPASPEGNVHTIPQTQPANTTIRRYEGKPSWAKPPHMSWQEWKDQGGNVPSWANVA